MTTEVYSAHVRSVLRAIGEVLAVAEDDASSLSHHVDQHRWAEESPEAEAQRKELKQLAGFCWSACASARRALHYRAEGAVPHADLAEAHTSISKAHAELFHQIVLNRLTTYPVLMAQVWACHSSIQALMRLFALARGKV